MEHLVSRPDLESLLAPLAARVRDPRAGFFGPDSLTWRINRESALFLGAGRAALLQLAHPWVAAAIAQHSTVLNRPIVRFHNTFRIVYTMLFGSLEQALAAARSLHTLHTRIGGHLPEPAGSWPADARYEANEVAALRWVYATLIETAVLAYETVLPLTAADRERYYRETKTFAALFGLPASALPSDWAAFRAWNQQMAESPVLAVSPASRAMGEAILSGAGSWIRPPRWYRALTAAWMPPRLRESFGLTPAAGDPIEDHTEDTEDTEEPEEDQRALHRVRCWLPRLYTRMPSALRFVGPYHEAQARLGNRPLSYLAQQNNRFWIGQLRLPFGKEV